MESQMKQGILFLLFFDMLLSITVVQSGGVSKSSMSNNNDNHSMDFRFSVPEIVTYSLCTFLGFTVFVLNRSNNQQKKYYADYTHAKKKKNRSSYYFKPKVCLKNNAQVLKASIKNFIMPQAKPAAPTY